MAIKRLNQYQQRSLLQHQCDSLSGRFAPRPKHTEEFTILYHTSRILSFSTLATGGRSLDNHVSQGAFHIIFIMMGYWKHDFHYISIKCSSHPCSSVHWRNIMRYVSISSRLHMYPSFDCGGANLYISRENIHDM